jgi:hypothetical protein
MSLKQFFVALVLCAGLMQVGLKCAHAQPPYEVTLEDEFGNPLPAYWHRGELFAMGRYGRRYNVRVTNHTGKRVEAVVSVDGRDVISGRPGNFKDQRGYLVNGYDSVLIEGFRTSESEVAAFRFTSPGGSYSSRMGTPENVGVIGAAFFPEAPPPPRPMPLPRPIRPMPMPESRAPLPNDSYGDGLGTASGRSESAKKSGPSQPSAAPTSAAESPRRSRGEAGGALADRHDYEQRDSQASNIGTEYGEAQYSSVVEVPFRRAHGSSPDRVITLRYDDRAGLEARGIVTRPRPRARYYEPGPVAFPENRFAPPPPGY